MNILGIPDGRGVSPGEIRVYESYDMAVFFVVVGFRPSVWHNAPIGGPAAGDTGRNCELGETLVTAKANGEEVSSAKC